MQLRGLVGIVTAGLLGSTQLLADEHIQPEEKVWSAIERLAAACAQDPECEGILQFGENEDGVKAMVLTIEPLTRNCGFDENDGKYCCFNDSVSSDPIRLCGEAIGILD